jgi:Zn-dependent protease/predicted transcriptional regulator
MFPQSGWTIGRIAGIEIKVNVSLLLIAALVTMSLALRVLPRTAPGANAAIYWFSGGIGAAILIGSILWHELAHSIVALRFGIPVVQIVLHLFGGVAQISRDPERPGQEFWIAVAGPVSSLILALAFGMLSRIGGIVGAVCSWLALINISLSTFNLLPGFPLDGGRILRSILWRLGGSYRQATRQASRIGQFMAGTFVLGGVILFISGDLFSGLWACMIAAFLYSAATLSYRATRSASLPMDTPVSKVMRVNVPIIDPEIPLALLAWKYLDHARDQAFPVMRGDELVGMITTIEIDHVPRLEWGKHRVEAFMIARERLCIVSPHDDIAAALAAMKAVNLDHAPVYDGASFIGMLNRRDIVYRT